MILVDSSVWIDYFNGADNPHTSFLHAVLGQSEIAVGDLILTEVLQGFRSMADFDSARDALLLFPVLEMVRSADSLEECGELPGPAFPGYHCPQEYRLSYCNILHRARTGPASLGSRLRSLRGASGSIGDPYVNSHWSNLGSIPAGEYQLVLSAGGRGTSTRVVVVR